MNNQTMNNQTKSCITHQKENFVMSKRVVTVIAALGMLLLALTFLTGYFWGKHAALEDLVRAMEEKSLGNNIAASLYSFALPQDGSKENEAVEQETFVIETTPELESSTSEAPMVEASVVVQPIEVPISDQDIPISTGVPLVQTQGYCAQLIGFNSKKAAQAFAQRVEPMGIPIMVKERTSVTARGQKKSWYQVVTGAYVTKEALEQAIDPIVKKEKLNGITIATCSL